MTYTLKENLEKLREIATLEAGCDGYGDAVPIDKKVLKNVAKLLKVMAIQPFVVPLMDGGIQVEWELENGDYFEVGCQTNDKYHIFVFLNARKHVAKDFVWNKPKQDFVLLNRMVEKFYDGILDIELVI